MIFITHDFGVVAEIADRIVVMNNGAIVETGSREEILSRPKQAYTRMLVSSVPSLTPKDDKRLLGEPILAVTGLSRVYREFKLFRTGRSVNAVKDAEFTLRKAEIVGIVGESGSGKSTLARCISRLIEPTTGKIDLGGHDIASLSPRQFRPFRRRIQIVFQDPYRSLNARLRVGESIGSFYGYKFAGIWQNAKQIAAAGQKSPVVSPGDPIYVDQNHDSSITGADRVIPVYGSDV